MPGEPYLRFAGSCGLAKAIEAVSVIRRQLANGALTPAQANNAIEDLLNLPITVYPTAPLLRRAWCLAGA